MDWIIHSLADAAASGTRRVQRLLHWVSPTEAVLDGRRVTVFCSNDYLGLRHSERLREASVSAIRSIGAGAGASRLVTGESLLHARAEALLATLVGRQSALLLSSGYAANVGALAALAGPDDLLLSDQLNHASLIDGARLSRARVVVYPHCDAEAVAESLETERPYRRAWIVTESLFSMDGDHAPLLAFAEILRERSDAHLYLDEAHAIGVLGPSGQGVAAEFGVSTDVLVGTLGKALGGQGAFVSGSAVLRDFLWNHCRSFVFSTGVAPALAGAAMAAAALVREGDGLRTILGNNVRLLRAGLSSLGLEPRGRADSPIVPLIIGTNEGALALSARLEAAGFFVQAIRPPTVPRATARLRITVSAAHKPEQIDALVQALARVL